jgi:hypothetical protein
MRQAVARLTRGLLGRRRRGGPIHVSDRIEDCLRPICSSGLLRIGHDSARVVAAGLEELLAEASDGIVAWGRVRLRIVCMGVCFSAVCFAVESHK